MLNRYLIEVEAVKKVGKPDEGQFVLVQARSAGAARLATLASSPSRWTLDMR